MTVTTAATAAATAAAPSSAVARNEITLKGSVEIVTEFFGYAINKCAAGRRGREVLPRKHNTARRRDAPPSRRGTFDANVRGPARLPCSPAAASSTSAASTHPRRSCPSPSTG
jgi:hypothetical protein